MLRYVIFVVNVTKEATWGKKSLFGSQFHREVLWQAEHVVEACLHDSYVPGSREWDQNQGQGIALKNPSLMAHFYQPESMS